MIRILNLCLLILIPAFLIGQNNHTRQKNLPCINKEFNIAIHIVKDANGDLGITQSEIDTALFILNKNVAPICASFKICSYDTIDNYQYDNFVETEYYELMVKYNKKNRINIYYVSRIGLAVTPECTFSGEQRYDDPENFGFVLSKYWCATPEFQGMSHEMGHFWGLLSTWGEDNIGIDELVDGSNCEIAGDKICDTPADFKASDINFSFLQWVEPDCVYRYFGVDANGQPYRPDTGNTMSDYIICRCGFSYEQLLLMANNMLEAELW